MNVAVTNAAEGLPRRAFTIADVERMVEVGLISPDERLEILGGEIVPMSPKGSRHEAIKTAITRLWGRTCPDGWSFAQETGLRLSEDTYLEPDFVVFRDDRPLASVKGPDVVVAVEVADSSLDYDLRRKPLIYAGFGIGELWVIDAARKEVHVHRSVGAKGYGNKTMFSGSDRITPETAPAALAFALSDFRL